MSISVNKRMRVLTLYLFIFFNRTGEFVSYLAVVAIPTAGTHFFLDLSLLFTARQLGAAVAYYLVPFLLQRYSEKRCVLIANLLSAAAVAVIIFSMNHLLIVACGLFLLGCTDNLILTAIDHYNSYAIQDEEDLLHMNHSIQILTYVTMILGGTMGGLLIATGGVATAFLVDGTSYLLSALFIPFIFVQNSSGTRVSTSEFTPRLSTVSSSILLMIFGWQILISAVVATFNLVEIPYYLRHLQISYAQIGPFFSVTIVGLILARVVLKKYGLAILNTKRFFVLGCGFGLSFASLSFTNNLVLGAIILLSFIGVLSVLRAILTQIVQTRVQLELRSKVLSLMLSIGRVVTILTTLIAGYLADRFGLLESMQMAALLYLLALFPLLMVMNMRGIAYVRS